MTTESFGVNEGENSSEQITRRGFLKGIGAGVTLAALGLNAEAKDSAEKEGSPFAPEAQRAALQFVAKAMNVALDAGIALPAIIESETVSDADFNRVMGFDTGGKRQNIFLPPGTIFLLKKSEMHNLVHEFVHYVQYHYKGITDGTTDEVENEAVAIQNLFREKGSRMS